MIFDINIDELDDILSIRTQAIQALKDGALEVTTWSSEGTSVSKIRGMSLKQILEETRLYLQQYDPDLYGKRVKKTVPYYTQT